ncbi:MAG: YeiH family protein [Ilumatobacteraceae bacterium]
MIRKKFLPGLTLAGTVVAVAFLIESLVTRFTPVVLSPLVVSVVLGALISNLGLIPSTCESGMRFAAKSLLRLGIVLLGLQLSLTQVRELGTPGLILVAVVVGVTFFGTQWLGRRMGLSGGLSLLVATGFSICGASAIAAMRPVSDADDDDMAYAIALVTICGSLAIFVLPLVARIIGFDGAQFGSWVGASVHDVAQTVATSSSGNDDAQHAAIIVKLTRVMLLAPMVAGVSIARRRKLRFVERENESNAERYAHPPLIPLFVVGFLVAITINSVVDIPRAIAVDAKWVEQSLLGAALVGLGAGVDIQKLRAIGVRPLALGLLSWVLIAVLSGVGVVVLNIV